MAAVSLSPLPQPPHFSMASRRAPLANNPNAVNSPFRTAFAAGVTGGNIAAKRSRTQANDTRDRENESPPKKKQIIENVRTGSRRPQPAPIDDQEGRVFTSVPENTKATAFQRKLAAHSKSSQHQQQQLRPVERTEKQSGGDLESIRQWRRHYRRVFPTFVFYFESLPIDVCIRSSRQIADLGAREEKFFSRLVTHVVTSRPVPPVQVGIEPSESQTTRNGASHARTINPSLLDKSTDLSQNNNGRNAVDTAVDRKTQGTLQDAETRKGQITSTDVLHKAREMNIKIWALEKFERMMHTMFDDLDESTEAKRKVASAHSKVSQDTGLSQMLRNEKKQQASRAPWSEIVPFRSFYIYIHDVDEKTKPIAVREYKKVANKEDGDWPQFRSTALPRSPFIEDHSREEREKAKQKSKEEKGPKALSVATEAGKARDGEASNANALKENDRAANRGERGSTSIAPTKATFDPPRLKPSTSGCNDSVLPSFGNRFNFTAARPGREPAASGLQKSNITSAIKSQMISSTTSGQGARAGTTKEIHQLQRRAVERRSGLSTNSMPTSYGNEVRATIKNEPANTTTLRRITRSKAVEPLARIHEDQADSEDENEAQQETLAAQISKAPKKKKATVTRKAKPGYCENCRDKYDDFDTHIESRKHKKFALTIENWSELDNLLKKLVRC